MVIQHLGDGGGKSAIQGQTWLQSKCEGSWGYKRLTLQRVTTQSYPYISVIKLKNALAHVNIIRKESNRVNIN